ncbi:MAG: lipid-A-disaccharide synthase [Kiritimatiellae bacterium]|nr:lipid-A-disaccharide synthase [Kiritimatiellia bacterium]
MQPEKLMIVAGEESGDQHAARLVRDLRKARPGVELWGIGGAAMRREGVRILVDSRVMAVLGLWEVLARIGFFRRVFKRMKDELRLHRPDALLLVDYPGFNLRLAREAHAMKIPVFYYISPQVWAWNRGRIPKMARIIDLLMVIFPFETAVFEGTGLRTVFVGHPLVESVKRTLLSAPAPLPWPGGEDACRVAILPGSRRMEIRRILPAQIAAALELRRRRPDAVFVVAASNDETAALIRRQLDALPAGDRAAFGVAVGTMRDVCRTARAAMVCSGTATVETALLGCPMIVVYRAAWPTYWVGRMVIRVKWLGMVNLIADRTLCPEFIQRDAKPAAMADALESLLDDGPERTAQLDGLRAVAASLEGNPELGPGEVVAAELARRAESRGA